jgi:hypothetical protein
MTTQKAILALAPALFPLATSAERVELVHCKNIVDSDNSTRTEKKRATSRIASILRHVQLRAKFIPLALAAGEGKPNRKAAPHTRRPSRAAGVYTCGISATASYYNNLHGKEVVLSGGVRNAEPYAFAYTRAIEKARRAGVHVLAEAMSMSQGGVFTLELREVGHLLFTWHVVRDVIALESPNSAILSMQVDASTDASRVDALGRLEFLIEKLIMETHYNIR